VDEIGDERRGEPRVVERGTRDAGLAVVERAPASAAARVSSYVAVL
jgi:hypothetical protein